MTSWQAPVLDIILEILNLLSMWKTCLEVYNSVGPKLHFYWYNGGIAILGCIKYIIKLLN